MSWHYFWPDGFRDQMVSYHGIDALNIDIKIPSEMSKEWTTIGIEIGQD